MSGLTIKQEKFAREYVKDGNGTRAAIKAGYKRRSAQQIATENLLKPLVSAEIQALRNRMAEKLDVSRERLVNNTAHIAEQAQAEGQYGAAINANALIMKAQGYLVERQLNMSVDVTQSHLDALQSYTDRRITEEVGKALNAQRGEQRDERVSNATDLDITETS